MLLLLLPDFIGKKMVFDKKLLMQMLNYGWPLLIVGLAGMANQNIEKILMPKLLPASVDGLQQLGIYAANFKLAVLMNLFIQAFRYSFEPFFFSHYKGEDSKMTYALVMKYFVIFGLLIFLSVMLYIGIAKYFIGSRYYEGLRIVPFILMGYFFQGIFYTLSLWYKLTDKTSYGAKLALLGAVVTIGLNVLFIPVMGYMASALAFLIASVVMTVASYLLGQKHFPVKYDLKRVALYFGVALVLYIVGVNINVPNHIIHYGIRTIVIIIFLAFVVVKEKKELKRLFV
jgi:O-antigen/teichoic acid export membrane protein